MLNNLMFEGRSKNLRPGFRADDRVGRWSLYALVAMLAVGAVSGALKHGDNFADKVNTRGTHLAKVIDAPTIAWEAKSLISLPDTLRMEAISSQTCINNLANLDWMPASETGPCLVSPLLCQNPRSKKKV